MRSNQTACLAFCCDRITHLIPDPDRAFKSYQNRKVFTSIISNHHLHRPLRPFCWRTCIKLAVNLSLWVLTDRLIRLFVFVLLFYSFFTSWKIIHYLISHSAVYLHQRNMTEYAWFCFVCYSFWGGGSSDQGIYFQLVTIESRLSRLHSRWSKFSS